MKNRPTGMAMTAAYIDGEGWQLGLHRAFTDDEGRTTTYRMSYRGLTGPELVSVIDVELEDLNG